MGGQADRKPSLARRFFAVTVLSLALWAASISSAAAAEPLRVRKELRRLTSSEYQQYIQGLGVMLSVATEAGALIFGPRYKEYNYFVNKHAINTVSKHNRTAADGVPPNATAAPQVDIFDLAHFGPWFITFHAALILEFENSMLSVVPGLKALPYWEMYEDLRGTPELPGRYYNTSKSMFTTKFAGNLTGDPAYGYSVRDGVYSGREVPRFDFVKYGYISSIYNGSRVGLLRSPFDETTFPYLIRYPASNLAQVPWFTYYAPGLELNFTKQDLARCTNTSIVRTSWDFVLCMDFTASSTSGLDPNITAQWLSSVSSFNHNLMHATVAGSKNNSFDPETGDVAFGDCQDLATSLNEAIMFFPFHSNFVRAFMIWQHAMTAEDPSQAEDSVLWGYPQSVNLDNPPFAWPGTELDAQITPPMPFLDVFPERPTPNGITHRDVMVHLRHPAFTYDDMSF